MATSSRDHTVRIWPATIDLATQLAQAYQHVFRNLTPEERRGLGMPA